MQGGWIWAEAHSNVEYQNPELWGWHRKDGRILPKWQEQCERTVDITDIIKKQKVRKHYARTVNMLKAN